MQPGGVTFQVFFNMAYKMAFSVNPRLTVGPPLPNIRDSSKTNRAIDSKLGRPSHTTI